MSVSTNSSVTVCVYVVEVEDFYGRSRVSLPQPEAEAYAAKEGAEGNLSDYYHSARCACGWFERE